ncbi:MAG: glycosyltransferase family 2 protein [Planctomycetes bacterium]|nr:glycosyltransferase family 2 protein [Planctomycetota bacterium]
MSTFVSIGMPVYNGGEALRRALDSLLAQSHTNFELIISDNASTDSTQAITEEYARKDCRIRLTRQPVNQGAFANFLWVLDQARGQYFMWAAHDDAWSANYVESLSNQLDNQPQAVLATATTCALRQSASGGVKQTVVSAAPNGDRWKTLDVFLAENICVWIYGMYQTTWLKQAAAELTTYPFHGGDRLWLFGLILKSPVVGDPTATFFYSDAAGKRNDRSVRARIRFLGQQAYHLTRLSWTRLPACERFQGLRRVGWYLYRHQISRKNPIGTLARMIKISVLGLFFGIEACYQSLATPRRSTP